jgi:hypothetical protein
MLTADELRQMAHDLYAKAGASRDPFTRQKLRKSADGYLKEAEQLRQSRNIHAVFPKKASTLHSTKYTTSAPVLTKLIEDMRAAGLIDLKPDKEISLEPNKEISLAPDVQESELHAMSPVEPALQPPNQKEQEGRA